MSNISRDYIKEYYNLPNLKKGLKITYKGMPGEIIGFVNAYIKIKTDNNEIKGSVHPQDENLKIIY